MFSVQIWTYKRTFFIRFLILKTMATIKLALLRHTQAKDGTYKIRIAVGHKNGSVLKPSCKPILLSA